MTWIKEKALAGLVFIFISLFTLELAAFLLSKGGLLLINDTPTAYLGDLQGTSGLGVDWKNENSPWGAWHKPNTIDRHLKECFAVTYQSNSVGARDREFTKKSTTESRYILLGDSFAEGYGVNNEKTAKSLLENKLGSEIMNFGASGSLGPLSYYLLYEKLAKNYEHDGLIIFFLPSNDFTDNDYSYWKSNRATYINNGLERYRPYYRKLPDNNYEFFYPEHAVKRDRWEQMSANPDISFKEKFKLFVAKYTWTSNVWRTLILSTSQRKVPKITEKTVPYSGYFDATVDQQLASVYWVEQIVKSSSAKKIIIISIPIKTDFDRLKNGAVPDDQLWQKRFTEITQKSSGKVRFLDLAKSPPAHIQDLYHSCDFHWNDVGNKWAADIITESIYKN